jgi:hypothetical protein
MSSNASWWTLEWISGMKCKLLYRNSVNTGIDVIHEDVLRTAAKGENRCSAVLVNDRDVILIGLGAARFGIRGQNDQFGITVILMVMRIMLRMFMVGMRMEIAGEFPGEKIETDRDYKSESQPRSAKRGQTEKA